MEAGFHIKGDDSGGDDVEEDGENEEEEDHGEGTKKPYGHTISVVHPKRKHEHSTITTMTNGDNSKELFLISLVHGRYNQSTAQSLLNFNTKKELCQRYSICLPINLKTRNAGR